jgi:hypothetical protein
MRPNCLASAVGSLLTPLALCLLPLEQEGHRVINRCDTEVLEQMAHEEAPHPKEEPVPDYQQALSNLTNPQLLLAPSTLPSWS